MMYKSKKIKLAWEKWENILEEEDTSIQTEKDQEETLGFEDTGLDVSADLFASLPSLPKNPVVMTRMGAFSVPGPNSDNFNFWVGHTNFNIGHGVAKTIEQVDGVETLDIYTRYRMRVCIGRHFQPREVFANIESAISGYLCQDQEAKSSKNFTP